MLTCDSDINESVCIVILLDFLEMLPGFKKVKFPRFKARLFYHCRKAKAFLKQSKEGGQLWKKDLLR